MLFHLLASLSYGTCKSHAWHILQQWICWLVGWESLRYIGQIHEIIYMKNTCHIHDIKERHQFIWHHERHRLSGMMSSFELFDDSDMCLKFGGIIHQHHEADCKSNTWSCVFNSIRCFNDPNHLIQCILSCESSVCLQSEHDRSCFIIPLHHCHYVCLVHFPEIGNYLLRDPWGLVYMMLG